MCLGRGTTSNRFLKCWKLGVAGNFEDIKTLKSKIDAIHLGGEGGVESSAMVPTN